MKSAAISSAQPRQRVLLVTHSFDANFSMESRLSWFRAKNAAKHYDVTVVCAEPFADVRCDLDANIPGVSVVAVPHSAIEKLLIATPIGFYLAYRLWHRRVYRTVRALHARSPFALVHQVSYCGYREPGYCWKLDIPFVWGPIGGTQNVPWRFLNQFDMLGAIKESFRSVANSIQLRWGRRVGQAFGAAKKVFVANREIQQSFRETRDIALPCQLEIGIEHVAQQPRGERDSSQPLRVLWAGRLENWKGLPLLLRAVAALPRDLLIELRIVGSGSQENRLKRLARRLDIEDRLEWISLPDCGARDEHYQWADLFAFTSLRDTSGTGLLESLAAGIPIVGLNHQGARDIMSEDCAVPISVESPRQVIDSLQNAFIRLAEDSEYLHRLGLGALDRADRFKWEHLDTEMTEAYAQLVHPVSERRHLIQHESREAFVQQTTPVPG